MLGDGYWNSGARWDVLGDGYWNSGAGGIC